MSLLPTIIIGLIAVFIAWRQYVTARQKLRLDLFNRRFDIYKQVVELMELGVTTAPPAQIAEGLAKFATISLEAKFLFPEPITQIIDTVFEGPPQTQDITLQLKWMRKVGQKLLNEVKPFLDFTRVK